MSGEFLSGPIQFRYQGGRLEIRDTMERRVIRTLTPAEVATLRTLIAPSADLRIPATRVEVPDSAGLGCQLLVGREEFSPRLINLSLTGALAILPTHQAAQIKVGDWVQLTLELAGHRFRCRAEVKRREQNHVGLFFPGCIRAGEVTPPNELVQIFMALQRQSIVQRTDEDADQ
ncbi:MAG: PilZ domain-containing protein [Planctomycetaceae bacterium]|nr:PilZ domain-containing protein [Planctomycetaceae bacterium]